jgi:hypothetical protein
MLERLRLDQINGYVYNCSSTLFIVLKVVQKQVSDDGDKDSESESPSPKIPQTVHGRPRIDILDRLTVEISTSPGEARKYRCASAGPAGTKCTKTFKPGTKVRVLLRHCKECLKMTSEKRDLPGDHPNQTCLNLRLSRFKLSKSRARNRTGPRLVQLRTSALLVLQNVYHARASDTYVENAPKLPFLT